MELEDLQKEEQEARKNAKEMKTSSKILFGLGLVLIYFQYLGFKGNDFKFPILHKSDDFLDSFTKNLGTIIGTIFIGLIGILLIIISLKRKPKSN